MVEFHFAPKVIKKVPRFSTIDNVSRSIPTLLSGSLSLYQLARTVEGFREVFSCWAHETRSLDLKYISLRLFFMALSESLPSNAGPHFRLVMTTYFNGPNTARWPCTFNHNSVCFYHFGHKLLNSYAKNWISGKFTTNPRHEFPKSVRWLSSKCSSTVLTYLTLLT